MKTVVVAYVPPPTFTGGQAFFENINRFKTAHDLLLFSDHPYPNTVQLKTKPEVVSRANNKWALNNAIFLTGLKVLAAHSPSATHMIYVEADSRVGGHGWDAIIVDELLQHPGAKIGGSAVCWNPSNYDMEWEMRWSRFIAANNNDRNFPIPTYGCKGSAEQFEPCVFVNGSLGIYEVQLLHRLFHSDQLTTIIQARNMTAWDYEIGARVFAEYGHNAWSVVAHLNCIYSSYGDVLTTEDDRKWMLESGMVVGVHQIKSAWSGPTSEVSYERYKMEQGTERYKVEQGTTGAAAFRRYQCGRRKQDSLKGENPLPRLGEKNKALFKE